MRSCRPRARHRSCVRGRSRSHSCFARRSPGHTESGMDNKRPVFFISDRTGITAETLGHTLLTQFDEGEFKQMTLPFINSIDKARTTVEYVNHAAKTSKLRPIIFSTTVGDEIRAVLRTADALFLDLFDTFIGPIEG